MDDIDRFRHSPSRIVAYENGQISDAVGSGD